MGGTASTTPAPCSLSTQTADGEAKSSEGASTDRPPGGASADRTVHESDAADRTRRNARKTTGNALPRAESQRPSPEAPPPPIPPHYLLAAAQCAPHKPPSMHAHAYMYCLTAHLSCPSVVRSSPPVPLARRPFITPTSSPDALSDRVEYANAEGLAAGLNAGQRRGLRPAPAARQEARSLDETAAISAVPTARCRRKLRRRPGSSRCRD